MQNSVENQVEENCANEEATHENENIAELNNLTVSAVENDSVKLPKPARRTCNTSSGSTIEKITSTSTDASADSNQKISKDSTCSDNCTEVATDKKDIEKIKPKPLPRPRHNPPAKPKAVPPPRPTNIPAKSKNLVTAPSTGNSSFNTVDESEAHVTVPSTAPKLNSDDSVLAKRNETNANDQTTPSPRGSKAIIRKESASKAIDLIKKKSIQLKERSIKVFKSRASFGENEMNDTDGICESNNKINTATSKSNPLQTNCNYPSPDSNSSKGIVQRSSSERRPPPPRPALPSVLKTRRPSEVLENNKNSFILTSNTEQEPSRTFAQKKRDQPSHDLTCQLVDDVKTVEKPDKAEDLNSLDNIDSSVAVNSDNTESSPTKQNKPNLKPARPPPIKFDSSHLDAVSAKKISKAKDSQQKDDDDSFLGLIQKKSNSDKAKPEVDMQMKNYMSSESYCVALNDYNAENFTDISFKAGEKILVLKKLDDVLLFGRNEDGEEGPFPSKYVDLDDN